MRRDDSPKLQVCELACPSQSETSRTEPNMATLQFKMPPKTHHRHLSPGRRHTRPQSYLSMEAMPVVRQSTTTSSPLGQYHDVVPDNNKKTADLPAGTIVAIVFSSLILIFILTGAYAWASPRYKSRRDRRSMLEERGHYDDDIEMQAHSHTRESLLEQESEQVHQSGQHHRHSYVHHEEDGVGMGYDDEEDGKEARIEVGTARVAHIRRVPAGSVSITNIGRSKGPVSLGSSKSVRDVVSLPDLAWAETLTTGGGRRPGIAPPPLPRPLPPSTATAATTAIPLSATTPNLPTSVKKRQPSGKLQERSESRRAVKKKAIMEWCARGGGFGPYSAAY